MRATEKTVTRAAYLYCSQVTFTWQFSLVPLSASSCFKSWWKTGCFQKRWKERPGHLELTGVWCCWTSSWVINKGLLYRTSGYFPEYTDPSPKVNEELLKLWEERRKQAEEGRLCISALPSRRKPSVLCWWSECCSFHRVSMARGAPHSNLGQPSCGMSYLNGQFLQLNEQLLR